MSLEAVGKALLVGALILLVAGGLMLAASKLGLTRLPGDLTFEGKGWRLMVPIATSILLSVVATVVLNVIARFWR